jgi:hypothetical protein
MEGRADDKVRLFGNRYTLTSIAVATQARARGHAA